MLLIAQVRVHKLNQPAKQAEEFSPGPAERNEVERSAAPGNWRKRVPTPALAGERPAAACCRPLKRALRFIFIADPGFRSLRSLRPGLNSSACYAGSLNGPGQASLWLTLPLLLLGLALAGCSHGIHSGTGGWPPAAAAPSQANATSSADVVKVRAETLSIPVGGGADATVSLSVSPGFHINANPATFSYLIATEITTDKIPGIDAGKPAYPAAEKKKFQFADEDLALYEGETQIKLPLHAETNALKGARSLPIHVRVQACDNEKCYAPATLDAAIALEVK